MNKLVPISSPPLPALVAAAGERVSVRFLEFFAANIRNRHTRRAYASPRNALAHFVRGTVLRAESRWQEAIPEYEAAIALNRNFVNASHGLAYCKLMVGYIDEAREIEDPDWATYGRLQENAEFRPVFAEYLKVAEVQDRSIIVGEEL